MLYFIIVLSIFVPVIIGSVSIDMNLKQLWPKFVYEILKEKDLQGCQVQVSFSSSKDSKDLVAVVKYLKSSRNRGFVIQNLGQNLVLDKFDRSACVLSIIKTDNEELKTLYKTILERRKSTHYLILLESAPKKTNKDSVSLYKLVKKSRNKEEPVAAYLFNIWHIQEGYRKKDSKIISIFKEDFSIQTRVTVAYPTYDWMPFFAGPAECLGVRCGSDVFLIEYITNQMNMEIVYVPTVDGQWGGLVGGTNDTWNGMIGMLQRKEVDFAIGGLTVTEPRAQAVDFSYPYFETSVGYMAHVPREMSKAVALIRPYDFTVWTPLILLVIISGPCLWFVSKKSRTNISQRRLSISRSYRITFQVILSQEAGHLPRGCAISCFTIAWCFASIVIYTGYTGRLISIFTEPELTEKLDNVKELVSRNDLIYITEADSAGQEYMKHGYNENLKKIAKLSEEAGFANPSRHWKYLLWKTDFLAISFWNSNCQEFLDGKICG